MDVVLLKLVSGEEVIAKKTSDVDNGIVISDARVLVQHPQPNGQVGISMLPFFAGAPENDVKLLDRDIMGTPIGPLPKQLEDNYLASVTNIALAGGGR